MLSNDKKRQVKVRLNEYFDFEQPVPRVSATRDEAARNRFAKYTNGSD